MSDQAAQNDRLDALLARLVEGTISQGESEELEEFLDQDEPAQRRYLHYLGLHADLQHTGRISAPGAEPVRPEAGSRRSSFLAIAACLAALAVAAALFVRPAAPTPDPAPLPIARLVELNGSATWTGDGGEMTSDLSVDALLTGGTLETTAQNSWAEIEYQDGSRLLVSGPAVLTLSEGSAGKLVRLRLGELSVSVTPQEHGAPFRLVTSSAELEVLGTQFNVTADAFRTTVAVNEGAVRVKRLADGEEREVSANHRVVAALERGSRFEVTPRREGAETWSSELPRDLRYGEHRTGGLSGTGSILARPLLWREDPAHPLLLHLASLGPSEGDPPIRLEEGARVRIRGRLDRDHGVVFGFTTLHPRGGFAGKYITAREVAVDSDAAGAFEVTLPLDAFQPEKDNFPASPVGHELFDCWILTINEDAGLEISSVELLK